MPRQKTIFFPILKIAKQRPQSLALIDSVNTMTYSQLIEAVEEVAKVLLELRIKHERPILLIGENSIALCVMLLAAAHIEASVVMENARRTSFEIQKTISHANPSHIFYLFDNSPDSKKHCDYFQGVIHHNQYIGSFGLNEFSKTQGELMKDTLVDPDVAIIIYTTGSTGHPKGVMLTSENLSYIAKMMLRYRKINSCDKIFAVLPFTHVMGCASVLLGGLHAGASLYLVPKFSPAECVAKIMQEGITVMQGAPAMFAKIIEYCAAENIQNLDSLRFLGSGGAPIDSDLKLKVKKLFNCDLQNGYGLTEAASICWTRMDEPEDGYSVGRPLAGVEISFRDSELQPILDGEVGELWIRGPNLMRGYYQNTQLTDSVFDSEGWFNSQDLGYRDQDGKIYIVGRTKDLIIKSGFNVYPLEIEMLLNGHPGVLHSAVVGKLRGNNEEIHAFIELIDGFDSSLIDFNIFLSEYLSPYKRPDEIHVVPHLPLAANGKILKANLVLSYL